MNEVMVRPRSESSVLRRLRRTSNAAAASSNLNNQFSYQNYERFLTNEMKEDIIKHFIRLKRGIHRETQVTRNNLKLQNVG